VLAVNRPIRWIERETPISGFNKVIEDEEKIVLAESVAGLRVSFPDLVVHQRLEKDLDPAQALVEHAASARILVIGAAGAEGLQDSSWDQPHTPFWCGFPAPPS
jgi:hypothetical protein